MWNLWYICREDEYNWPGEHNGSDQELSFSEKCKICLRIFTNKSRYEDDNLRHIKQFSDLDGNIQCPSSTCGKIIPTKVDAMKIHNDSDSPWFVTEHFISAVNTIIASVQCSVNYRVAIWFYIMTL